jgi:hypothetical protein
MNFNSFENVANSVKGILRGEVDHKISLKHLEVHSAKTKQSQGEQINSKADIAYLCYLNHADISNKYSPFYIDY